MFIKAENLNEAFIALSRALVESGVNVSRNVSGTKLWGGLSLYGLLVVIIA